MANANSQSKAPEGLRERRARRRRINRIKTGIIIFIVCWMAVCMALDIFLLFRVSSQQEQIGILAEKMLEFSQASARNGSEPEDGSSDVAPSVDTGGDSADIDGGSPEGGADASEAGEDSEADGGGSAAGGADAAAAAREPIADVRDCLAPGENTRAEGDPVTVYLTFDDGPSENTPEILDVLKEHGVKATFFVTGKEDAQLVPYYKRIVDEGHTLGMHSYSHRYSELYQSVDSFSADFEKLDAYLENVAGQKCRYYRFPGGSSNQISNTDMNDFIDYLGAQGMVFYDWNVVCGDATSQIYTADELVENVMRDVPRYRYSVVLMHDASEKDSTVEALDKILQRLEEMDAEILPITEDSPVIHHTLS